MNCAPTFIAGRLKAADIFLQTCWSGNVQRTLDWEPLLSRVPSMFRVGKLRQKRTSFHAASSVQMQYHQKPTAHRNWGTPCAEQSKFLRRRDYPAYNSGSSQSQKTSEYLVAHPQNRSLAQYPGIRDTLRSKALVATQ